MPDAELERADLTEEFLSSLDRLDVGWTCTDRSGLAAALSDVIEPPAVGVSLPFEGLDLEAVDVTLHPTPAELSDAKTGVTAAPMAIASYGSIVIQSGPDATEMVSLFPDRHVAVLRRSDIVPDMTAAFSQLGPVFRENPVSAILATGPSATADMGDLVKGAHGPRSVEIVLVEDL
ncbi:MAG: lactate utilization protein C [Salinibacter sp.]